MEPRANITFYICLISMESHISTKNEFDKIKNEGLDDRSESWWPFRLSGQGCDEEVYFTLVKVPRLPAHNTSELGQWPNSFWATILRVCLVGENGWVLIP